MGAFYYLLKGYIVFMENDRKDKLIAAQREFLEFLIDALNRFEYACAIRPSGLRPTQDEAKKYKTLKETVNKYDP